MEAKTDAKLNIAKENDNTAQLRGEMPPDQGR